MSRTTISARHPYTKTSNKVLGAIIFEHHWKVIEIKARQNRGLDESVHAIENELFEALHAAMPKFDPSKSSEKTFAEMVLSHKIGDLWDHVNAKKFQTVPIPDSWD